jgi:hypothetical protein
MSQCNAGERERLLTKDKVSTLNEGRGLRAKVLTLVLSACDLNNVGGCTR